MNKVLIISYYWPPSGGAGVQRWTKLTKYLANKGIEIHVITVDPEQASYLQVDESLCDDIHPSVHVHTTSSFEPINYYAKLVGKSNVPTAGFSNVNNESWKQKFVTAIRSNLFIPDPRRGWNKYAYQKALQVIQDHDIKHLITTSPPHSTQLIGLKLKKKLKSAITWIADFRDPWSDIYYYELLQHSFFSDKINRAYERSVIEQSDTIITVGERFKDSLLSKTDKIDSTKIRIVTNGYDPDDFTKNALLDTKEFIISYVGTISDYYNPKVFFEALSKLIQKYPEAPIKFRLVGILSENLKKFIIDKISDKATFIPPVSHDKAVEFMQTSHLLLLTTQGEKGTIPGKTFEYLAAKRRIVCIGKGDAAQVIDESKAGKSFERDELDEIFNYLEVALDEFNQQIPFKSDVETVKQYSREHQAEQILKYCSN